MTDSSNIINSSIFNYIVDARHFTSHFKKIKTQECHYNIYIDVDWCKAIENIYNQVGSNANTKIAKLFNLTELSNEEENEIKMYAYEIGKKSKFWLSHDEEEPEFELSENSTMSLSEQFTSNLNTFILHIFLLHLQFKVNHEKIKNEFIDKKNEINDIQYFLSDENILELSDIINVNNVGDLLNGVINLGFFDNDRFRSDVIFEKDILRIKVKLSIPESSPHHWMHTNPDSEEKISHILHVNLVQKYDDIDKGQITFRQWLQNQWQLIVNLSEELLDLRELVKSNAQQNAETIHDLHENINILKNDKYLLKSKLEYITLKKDKRINELENELQATENVFSDISSMEQLVNNSINNSSIISNELFNKTSKNPLMLTVYNLLQVQDIVSNISNDMNDGNEETLPLYLREKLSSLQGNETEKIKEAIAILNSNVENYKRQRYDILEKKKDCSQKIDNLKKQIEQVEQKANTSQNNIDRNDILKIREKIENKIQDQEKNINIISKRIEKQTNEVHNLQKNLEMNKAKSNNEQYKKLTNKLYNLYDEKARTEKIHMESLQELEVVSSSMMTMIKNYSDIHQKQLFLLNKKKKHEKKLIDELHTINDLNYHETKLEEKERELKREIYKVQNKQIKMKHENVCLELISFYNMKKFNSYKTDVSKQLQHVVKIDKFIRSTSQLIKNKISQIGDENKELKKQNAELLDKINSLKTKINNSQKSIEKLIESKEILLNNLNETNDIIHSTFNHKKTLNQVKTIQILNRQIRVLETHNLHLKRQQEKFSHIQTKYVKIEEMSSIGSTCTTDTNETTENSERMIYLRSLDKLSSLVPLIRNQYGIRKTLFNLVKLTEILKLCKLLYSTKKKIDRLNNRKVFGLGGNNRPTVDPVDVELDISQFYEEITPINNALRIVMKYLSTVFIPRWRLKKYKEDGINRFPVPSEYEIMKFKFKMAIINQVKQQHMKQLEVQKEMKEREEREAEEEGFRRGEWEWEYYSESDDEEENSKEFELESS